jgi:hypothetical protein
MSALDPFFPNMAVKVTLFKSHITVIHACNRSHLGGGSWFKTSLGKKLRPYPKNKLETGAWLNGKTLV